jgi:hypothetical protein
VRLGKALLAFTLLSTPFVTACPPRTTTCVAFTPLAAPTSEVFEACGGLAYYAPPGPVVPMAITLDDTHAPQLTLRDVCIVMDGRPVHTARESEAFVGSPRDSRVWTGRVFPGHHVVQVQAIYRDRETELILRGAVEIVAHSGTALRLAVDGDDRVSMRIILPEPRCE